MTYVAEPGFSRRLRWLSLASGVAITIMLGSSYAYSVYIRPLVELWGSRFWASLPFSVLVAVFAFSGTYGGSCT